MAYLRPDAAHRILVVEDDATLRGVIRMVLERDGYTVEEAEHGEAALAALALDVPSAAVVDFKMPVMDGRELIGRMRADARMAAIPVVLLTGYGGQADGPDADAVLTKPFEPGHLLACLRELVRQKA